ncbi:MAG TPA: hypothetical protein PK361_07740 [Chiayiivirga sp.]|nr:hypothetical protein [Chiayiivirga sp.]
MHTIIQAHAAPTITRLSLYRALRHAFGPALAYRIAFGWRDAA